MKTKRAVLIAVLLLAIAAFAVFAAARILSGSVSITMASAPVEPPPPPELVLSFLSPWSCSTGGTIANCSATASEGLNATFDSVPQGGNPKAVRTIQNGSVADVCIAGSGLSTGGVVGSVTPATIPAGEQRDISIQWDVSALGEGEEVWLPTVVLSIDFCP